MAEQVDFSREIVTLENVPLKDQEGKSLTLGKACAEALLSVYDDEKQLAAEAKIERYKLAWKVVPQATTVELSAEEATLIRKVVNKRYSTLIVGQVYEIIK